MVDRREDNQGLIRAAEDQQQATKDGIFRIQRQLAETEQMGNQTLDELRKQGGQMDDIASDLGKVSDKLDQASSLQNTFDKWAGNWFGGKKKAALKEAAAEIAARENDALSKVKEVFEQETFTSMSRKWVSAGLVLCNDPTVSAPERLFDPKTEADTDVGWMIDYSLSGIDAEGWTYAYDFNSLNTKGVGKSAADWNCYVRRRKWRYNDNRNENAQVAEVRARNQARLEKMRPRGTGGDVGKIGYVPRAQQAKISASGLTSTVGRKKQEDLDDESAQGLAGLRANDQEIDQGLDNLSNALDRVANIAEGFKYETTKQNNQLKQVDELMTKAADKATVINSRQKHLLR
jgi:hypothetical protein